MGQAVATPAKNRCSPWRSWSRWRCCAKASEVVLFLYGIVAASNDGLARSCCGGVAAASALGAAVSFLLYRGLVAIPISRHVHGDQRG